MPILMNTINAAAAEIAQSMHALQGESGFAAHSFVLVIPLSIYHGQSKSLPTDVTVCIGHNDHFPYQISNADSVSRVFRSQN